MNDENDKNVKKDKKVETDVVKRWEQGIEHDPKSKELVKSIAYLDYRYGNDFFSFKIGGDGDNGEHLMYLLDIYYELKEEEQKKVKARRLKFCADLTRTLDSILIPPFPKELK